MPDSNGFPVASEVYAKIKVTATDETTADMDRELVPIISAVVAEFQSPPVRSGEGGGTGRRFQPVAETRLYDGSGGPELIIDDFLPSLPFSATSAGVLTFSSTDTPYPGLAARTPANPGDGYHTLVVPNASYSALGGLYSYFPQGIQNIAVAATFGNEVTPDIWEALRCEAAYRFLVQSFVGLTGVGESVSIGNFSINTSVGAINFRLTSPLTVFHDKFLAAVSRYRRSPQREWSRLAVRRQMS